MSFHSRQHAEWTLSQIHGELENGTFDPDFYSKTKKSLHSFSVYAEEWLRTCQRRVDLGKLSKDHFCHLRHYVNDLFIPAFGNTNITELRGKDINRFYLTLEKGPKTVYNIMTALHKLFNDAHDGEVIQQVPKFPADLKASQLPEPRTRWATEEVQEAIFAELEPDDLFFIMFQACHGTRTGETRALTHEDLDLQNDVVTICKAFSGNDLRHTKTKRIRQIPLDPVWKEIYLSRPRNINPAAFVFTRDGKPYSRTWAWRKWSEACEKAGVPNLTLYCGTRHSVASQAANRGVPIYSIAKFLGHSSLKVTERYARLDMSPLRAVLRKATLTPLKKKSELS
jgi:integrase